MWARLRIAIVKEVISYFRDPVTRRFMIGAPILQTVVFAFAGTLDVKNVDVAVLDLDNGRWSHELVARVDGAWFTDNLLTARDSKELKQLVSDRRALVALRLDPDFSRQLESGRTAVVQVIADGRRANAAQIAVSYLGSVVGELAVEFSTPDAGAAPVMQERHWFNTNLDYQWFMVANLTAVLGMMMCLVVTSLSIATEREHGTFDQLLVSPMTSTEIIIAKTMPGMLAGFIVSSIIVALAILVFRVPFTGSFILFPLALALFILSVVGVGLLISSVCNTQQQAVMGTFFSSIPFVLTSGFATPTENMPQWLQHVGEINPLKHFLLIVQGSFFKSQTIVEASMHMLPLVPIAIATLTIASISVRSRLQ